MHSGLLRALVCLKPYTLANTINIQIKPHELDNGINIINNTPQKLTLQFQSV